MVEVRLQHPHHAIKRKQIAEGENSRKLSLIINGKQRMLKTNIITFYL